MAIPKKVSERMVAGLKKLVPIIQQQRARDVSEADTVTLIKAVFAEIFGYDMFAELTGEFAIKGTYCDLAVRLDEKLCELVEAKAIGLTLTEKHLKQVVDYAANQGIEWVVLTNAVTWQLHHVIFAKPIDSRLVVAFDITAVDPRKESDLELVFPFTKEGFQKGVPAEIRDRQAATDRFLISALLLHNESVRNIIRRELRKVVDVNVTEEEVAKVLEAEVIKRDCLEGPKAEKAVDQVRKAQKLGPKPKTSVDDNPLPAASEGFWGPIRRGECGGGIFAGKPVPEDSGWISKTVRGIGISLELKNHDCSVAVYVSGEDRLERRARILSLLPADKYPHKPHDTEKFAAARFPVMDKGRKDPDHWDEARKKLVALGEEIYGKINDAEV